MSTSARLAMTHMEANQASAEVTFNDALNALDQLAALEVESMTTTAEPGSPSDGDAYILPASPTGTNWAGQGGKVAIYYDGWVFKSAKSGMQAFVVDVKELWAYSGVESMWFAVQPLWRNTEHWTGRYRETKLIYAKYVDFGAMPNATTRSVAHSITSLNLADYIGIEAVYYKGGTGAYPVQRDNTTAASWIEITGTYINIQADWDASTYSARVRLEYTKTA